MLYLKKIEMYGFKSFADKVELRFDQPVTGIVGPNGCGKSNISDAVRWVLGEQSTKNLRGKNMQDLIFSGTDIRKSMSYCEVSLYLDNTTRIFPLQIDEIIISRKLYRNNESEYYLNRNIVRLRDIQDLIRSVGLGREGYSIVGQGRMDAILNAKPEDRRAIFEEALGISRFRVKKTETERKLDKTRENMSSLNLLANELENQIGPLKRQAVNARKYIEYYDELKSNEINAYIYSYDNASANKESSMKKLTGLKEEYAYKNGVYADTNEQFDELFHRKNNIDAEITALHQRRLDLELMKSGREGDNKEKLARIDGCNNDIQNSKEVIANATKTIDECNEKINSLNASIVHMQNEKDSLDNEILALSDRYNTLVAKVNELTSNDSALHSQLEETTTAIADLSSKLSACTAQNNALSTRLDAIKNSEGDLTERLSKTEGAEGGLLKSFDELSNKVIEIENAIKEVKSKIKQLEFDAFDLNKDLQDKQKAYAGELGGIELLKDFANNYKGYQSSVQNLMKDAQQNAELGKRICGVVANLLHVDTKLQVAIESALGGRLQNIVTEDETSTKYLIEYLKSNGYGRITFLPISSMKAHRIDHAEVLKEHGVLGIAKDLVSFDKRYNSVFESLLGGIIIVDTYDNAVSLSRKYHYAHRMVTLTGERISDDGSIEGGSKRSGDNLLSYETQIAERTKTLETLKEQVDVALAKKNECDDLLAELRTTLGKLNDDSANVSVQLATTKEKIESSNTLNNNDKESILSLSKEKENIVASIDNNNALIEKCNESIAKLEESKKDLRTKIDTMKTVIESETAVRDGLKDTIAGKKFNLSSLSSNIDNANAAIQEHLKTIKDNEYVISSKELSISQVEMAIDNLRASLSENSSDDEIEKQLKEIVAQIASTSELKTKLENEYNEVSEKRSNLSTEIATLQANIEHENYVHGRIDDDLNALQQRVLEEYDITYSAAMQYKDDNFDYEKSKVRISELKTAIAHLGPVNVNAIEQLASTEERFGDIGKQLDDLHKAEADLKGILKDLTKEIETRFEDGMVKINENFKVVFRELFNGGNAKLYIDVDELKEPLDYGVEIEAQPPGKKLQNISLLSGGERTLTACAILFSILKFQPMPFCVLDEIEAALDDSNAERIAKYLRKFSEFTQFIVITHKKPTMENADVLYGVTMEEKGVSKIVSVKLTDAIAEAV